MNKFFIGISTLFLGYIAFGFYLSFYSLNLFSKDIKINNLFYNYKIQQNIYTNISIGSGTFQSITTEAQQVKSNFLLFTDLNPQINLDPDKYVMNMGHLFGAKIINEDRSYTVYSPNNKIVTNYTDPLFLKDHKNEILVINHMNTTKKWIETGDGLDVFNLKNSAYKVGLNKKISTLWSLLFYPFNSRLSLLRLYRDPNEELKIFDILSQKQKQNMYLSSEATAKAIPFANWLVKFPSYENIFEIASERIIITSELSHNIKNDKISLFRALKSGSFYISIDSLGDSNGFESYISDSNTNQYTLMGDSTQLTTNLKLHFKLPKEPNVFHEVVLYKNGERIDHLNTVSGDFIIKTKGVYRLQVRLNVNLPFPDAHKWLTWIFTNNFYVN